MNDKKDTIVQRILGTSSQTVGERAKDSEILISSGSETEDSFREDKPTVGGNEEQYDIAKPRRVKIRGKLIHD